MKRSVLTIALLLAALPLLAGEKGEKKEGISISFDSDDPHTRLVARHDVKAARLAIPTRRGAAVLLLTSDAVAVQLSDETMRKVETEADAGFLEELIVSGVRLAIGKSVEYPVARIRSAEIANGVLVLTSEDGKPVFDTIRVDGHNVTHDLDAASAARFLREFRKLRAGKAGGV